VRGQSKKNDPNVGFATRKKNIFRFKRMEKYKRQSLRKRSMWRKQRGIKNLFPAMFFFYLQNSLIECNTFNLFIYCSPLKIVFFFVLFSALHPEDDPN